MANRVQKVQKRNKHKLPPIAGKKMPHLTPSFETVPPGDEEDLPFQPFRPVYKPGAFKTKNGDVLRALSGQPFRNNTPQVLMFQCGKCHETMTETLATAHLLKCQPNGAICDNCKKVFSAKEFVEHIKQCLAVK
jgi:hypothetical protein